MLNSKIPSGKIQDKWTNHKLNMGIWQGIYLLEFRNGLREREIVITVYS